MLRLILAFLALGFFAFIAAIVAVIAGQVQFTTVLAWAGLVGLILFGLVLLAILLFVLKVRSAFKKMKSTLGADGLRGLLANNPFTNQPESITPRRGPDHEWPGPGAAAAAWLKSSDFQSAGTWTAAEIPTLILSAWIRADGAVVALSTLGEKAPFWIDVAGDFTDATTLTVTNSVGTSTIPTAPWKERGMLPPETGVADMVAEFDRRRAGRALKPLTAENFARHFADSYGREIEWTALRGEDEETFLRTAAARGHQPTPEQAAFYRNHRRIWATSVLTARMKPRLIEASGISATQWEKVSEKAIVVIDRMTGDDLQSQLSDPDGSGPRSDIPADPFACLAWHNGRVAQDRRLRVAARLDEPLRAELWVPAA